MSDERIASGWTLQLKPDNMPEGEQPQTLFFDLNIDDRGVVTGNVFRVDDGGAPGDEPLSPVAGRRQPSDNPDGSLLSLSFGSGDLDVFLSGFTFRDAFTRFEGRYLITPRNGGTPTDTDPAASLLAGGPGDTGTGTGQQT